MPCTGRFCNDFDFGPFAHFAHLVNFIDAYLLTKFMKTFPGLLLRLVER